MIKKTLFPNPHILFYFNAEGIVAADCFNNIEYQIEPDYFTRILFWDGTNQEALKEIDKELLEASLVLSEPSTAKKNWQGDQLSYFCHLSSRNSPATTPELTEEMMTKGFLEMSAGKERLERPVNLPILDVIALPKANDQLLQDASFAQTLLQRMTCRSFNGKAITLEELATVLYYGFAPVHGKDWGEIEEAGFENLGTRRTSPSGTAMQFCEAYVAVCNVDGLEAGIYRYDGDQHELQLLRPGFTDQQFVYSVLDQFWTKGIAVGIYMVGDLQRLWVKNTQARGYNLMMIEAGHLSQTLLLCGTALGLKTWLTGSFRDQYLNRLFGVDGERQFAVGVVALGHGKATPVPDRFKVQALAKSAAQ